LSNDNEIGLAAKKAFLVLAAYRQQRRSFLFNGM
jgi:hypothetical protein